MSDETDRRLKMPLFVAVTTNGVSGRAIPPVVVLAFASKTGPVILTCRALYRSSVSATRSFLVCCLLLMLDHG